jgi:hypothetical protein
MTGEARGDAEATERGLREQTPTPSTRELAGAEASS